MEPRTTRNDSHIETGGFRPDAAITAKTWRPTHRVPAGGLEAWTSTEAGADPEATINAGLPVTVLRSERGWARVRCENGWEAWVDASGLVGVDEAPTPVEQPSAAASARRWLLVAVLALAIGVIGLAVVFVTADGNDDTDEPDVVEGIPVAPAAAQLDAG